MRSITQITPFPKLDKVSRGFAGGIHDSLKGTLFNIPFIALDFVMAKRGEKIASLTGSLANIPVYTVSSAIIAAGLCMIPGVNVAVAALIAAAAATYPASVAQRKIEDSVRVLTKEAKRIGRLQLGGSYEDTPFSQTVRDNTRNELTYATQPARRLLGQEARFLHR